MLAFLALGGLAVGACGPARGANGAEIVIAVAGPMTGPASFQGRVAEEAVRLAVDERNSAGGIAGKKVRLLVLDDENSPKVAATRAAEAADAGAVVALGHRSSEACVAAGRVYGDRKLPAITGSASAPEITRGNPWYFRMIFDNEYQGAFLAGYARQVLGFERASIVAASDVSGRSIADAFRAAAAKNGLAIAAEFGFDPKAPNVDDVLKKMADELSGDDARGIVFVAGSEVPARRAIHALREKGPRYPILAGQAVGRENFNEYFEKLPAERENPGYYTDGVYAAAIALPDTGGDAAQGFINRYSKKYGHRPDGAAAGFYDAAGLAMEAIERTGAHGVSPAEARLRIRDHLAAIRNPSGAFSGVLGRTYFDSNRNAVRPVPIGTFVRGTLISAPTQLNLIADPLRVPNFEDGLENGSILSLGDQFMAKTQVVYAGIDIVSVPSINLREDSFAAEFFVWFRFQGELDLSEIQFPNAVEPIEFGEPLWDRTRGEFRIRTYRLKGTFRGDFEFKDYPFERHSLRIQLQHRTRTVGTLVIALDRLGMATDPGWTPLKKLQSDRILGKSGAFRLADAVHFQDSARVSSSLGEIGVSRADSGLEYSRVNTVLTVQRNVLSYALKNLAPLFFVLIVLYASFFISMDDLCNRGTFGLTALLTTAVLHQQMLAELPNIGYVVAMDYGYYLADGISIYAVVISVIGALAVKDERAVLIRRLDLSGRIGIPLVVLALLASLGARYMW